MKNGFWVTLVLLFGLMGCDSNSNQEAGDVVEDMTVDTVEDMTADTTDNMGEMSATDPSGDLSLTTPADMSEEAQTVMYKSIFDYNECMMTERLTANQNGQQVQQAADAIMASCETHIDEIKELLTTNEVNDNLIVGITKKMRSRAARKLMTQSMNGMAAQAAAIEAAEQMKAQ